MADQILGSSLDQGGTFDLTSRTRAGSLDKEIEAPGFVLQESPLIYLTALPGTWLLERTTPRWRIKNPQKGFQRVVKDKRARSIAIAVLDQRRTFPNAIILATDSRSFRLGRCTVFIPSTARFLVVDGQHRLWSQKFSDYEATYACLIHMDLSVEKMAELFLEINDNQKRVPSSLRWDLVRLVRPEGDQWAIMTSELIYELSTNEESPLYQQIDLTGEQPEIRVNQGSLAPEVKQIISARSSTLRDLDFGDKYEVLTRYISAIRDLDPDGWKNAKPPFYQARVLRALIRFLPDIIQALKKKPLEVTTRMYLERLRLIDPKSLSSEAIRAQQGSAGIKAIYEQIKSQVLGK